MKEHILPLLLAIICPLVATANQLTVESDLVIEGDTTLLGQSLTVLANNGVLFEGTFGQGTIPVEGNGPRMMWYPGKAAFRVGRVSYTDAWHDPNVGDYSTGWGRNSEASGENSTAWGSESRALGEDSTAWGYASIALGSGSTAWGWRSYAVEDYSTAWGWWSSASGYYSSGWGQNAHAAGDYSTAWGTGTIAIGQGSTAWGIFTDASGGDSTAWGQGSIAESFLSTAIGRYNFGGYTFLDDANNDNDGDTVWFDRDPLFEIGNGYYDEANQVIVRQNALTVLKNGKVGIGLWDEDLWTSADGGNNTEDSLLRVKGKIESTEGGFVLPDGTVIASQADLGGSGGTAEAASKLVDPSDGTSTAVEVISGAASVDVSTDLNVAGDTTFSGSVTLAVPQGDIPMFGQ